MAEARREKKNQRSQQQQKKKFTMRDVAEQHNVSIKQSVIIAEVVSWAQWLAERVLFNRQPWRGNRHEF
ncbi:hypothetical protein ANTPLA_LOCUS10624 [Anthophora plagiata]